MQNFISIYLQICKFIKCGWSLTAFQSECFMTHFFSRWKSEKISNPFKYCSCFPVIDLEEVLNHFWCNQNFFMLSNVIICSIDDTCWGVVQDLICQGKHIPTTYPPAIRRSNKEKIPETLPSHTNSKPQQAEGKCVMQLCPQTQYHASAKAALDTPTRA